MVEHEEDLTQRADAIPWYAPSVGNGVSARNYWELLTGLRLSLVGRFAVGSLLRFLGGHPHGPA